MKNITDIKFRVRLKTRATAEIITTIAKLYDEQNGLMQFPIDLEKFEVLSIDRFANFTEDQLKNPMDLYENDIISFQTSTNKNCPIQTAVIIMHFGAFSVHATKDDPNYFPPLYACCNIKKLGNIYDNSNLLNTL